MIFGLLLDNQDELTPEEVKKYQKREQVNFKAHYETWYSESYEIIRQILPNRLQDFRDLYKAEKRKDINFGNYTLSDYMIGLTVKWGGEPTFSIFKAAFQKFQQQLLILKSVEKKFTSSLFDIKTLVQADLFDSELKTAEELMNKGFLRASGAVCGVVLEKHLEQVLENHKLSLNKKNPGIADYNDELKKNGIIDVPTWRKIQHLGDIRNTCDHNKKIEPSKENVKELIEGCEKIIKNVF